MRRFARSILSLFAGLLMCSTVFSEQENRVIKTVDQELSQMTYKNKHYYVVNYELKDPLSGAGEANVTIQQKGWESRDHLFNDFYETGGKKLFVFNPRNRSWAVYDQNGSRVATGVASGGGEYCTDVDRACRTPEGEHRVYRKGSLSCASKTYPLPNGGAKMPMCMFFRGGYAIHGSDDVPERYNASHGCIRVQTPAAIWLNRQFLSQGASVWVLPY